LYAGMMTLAFVLMIDSFPPSLEPSYSQMWNTRSFDSLRIHAARRLPQDTGSLWT